jgi:cytosine/adenosine deaminase-related metal-dependent hydrolase
MTPIHGKRGLISNLVYSFSGKVDDVIVDGNVVVESGEVVKIGREKVLEAANQLSEKF